MGGPITSRRSPDTPHSAGHPPPSPLLRRLNLEHPDFVGRHDNFEKLIDDVRKEVDAYAKNRTKGGAAAPSAAPASAARDDSTPRLGLGFGALYGGIVRKRARRVGKSDFLLPWQTRYLALEQDKVLRYYKNQQDGQMLGAIELAGCEATRADGMVGKAFVMRIKVGCTPLHTASYAPSHASASHPRLRHTAHYERHSRCHRYRRYAPSRGAGAKSHQRVRLHLRVRGRGRRFPARGAGEGGRWGSHPT